MPSEYVPPTHKLIRFTSWTKLRRDEDDNVVGVLGDAFHLRAGETNLSSTWCEYFDGDSGECFLCAVRAIRNTLEAKPKSAFIVGQVAEIDAFMQRHSFVIRVVHEPEEDNPAHVAVRRWPSPDNRDLFDALAEEVWNDVKLNGNIIDDFQFVCLPRNG